MRARPLMRTMDRSNRTEAEEPDIMQFITFIHSWLASTDRERGAGLAEYALLLVLIAVACLVALGDLGEAIAAVYDQITGSL